MRQFSALIKTVVLIATLVNLLGAVVVSAATISVDIPNVGCPIGGPCPTASEAKGNISQAIIRIYQFAVAIAGILAVGMIVAGSVYYSASAGSPDRQSEGKDMITSAVWGIVLLFGSYLILNTVNPRLTALEQPYAPAAVPCQYDAQGKLIKQYDAQGNLLPCIPPAFSYQDILIPGDTEATALSAEELAKAEQSRPVMAAYCHALNPEPTHDQLMACIIRGNCTGCRELDPSLRMRPDQCKWGGEASDCLVNPKTNSALLALLPKLTDEGVTFLIVEAFPPTVTHKSNEHYNGCAVDIHVNSMGTKSQCEAVITAVKKAEEAGFRATNEYHECGGKVYGTTTGDNIHLAAKNCP